MKLSGWGRYPVADCMVTAPRTPEALAGARKSGPLIARRNGRAYGDSAMNDDNTVSMPHFNLLIAFFLQEMATPLPPASATGVSLKAGESDDAVDEQES